MPVESVPVVSVLVESVVSVVVPVSEVIASLDEDSEPDDSELEDSELPLVPPPACAGVAIPRAPSAAIESIRRMASEDRRSYVVERLMATNRITPRRRGAS